MSGFGEWGTRFGNKVQAPASTKQTTNVKTQGEEFSQQNNQHLGDASQLQGSYIAIRLTVARSAPYGTEKLECSMEVGTPCEPTQQGRDMAFQMCVNELNSKIPLALQAANETFKFESQQVKGLTQP